MNAITPTQRFVYAAHLWLVGVSLKSALAYLGPINPLHECGALDWCASFAARRGRFAWLRRWLVSVDPETASVARHEIEEAFGPF